MKKSKKKGFSTKLNRVVSAVQIAVTVIVAAVTVYTLIPRHEKLNGVNAEALVNSKLPENEASEEAAEEEVNA